VQIKNLFLLILLVCYCLKVGIKNESICQDQESTPRKSELSDIVLINKLLLCDKLKLKNDVTNGLQRTRRKRHKSKKSKTKLKGKTVLIVDLGNFLRRKQAKLQRRKGRFSYNRRVTLKIFCKHLETLKNNLKSIIYSKWDNNLIN
jgi:hypothetical protein